MADGRRTLAELRTAVRERADMVASQFVTDAELNRWINSSAAELYDLLVQKYGADYFVTLPAPSYVIETSGQVVLPSEFYKLLGVDLKAGGEWRAVQRFAFGERNRQTEIRYRLRGPTLWFAPAESAAGQTVRVWYVPKPTEMTGDTMYVEGISGWEEYVVVDCAIKALAKEESDPSVFMAQKAALIQRIEAAAENRDAGLPARVADVTRRDWSDEECF